MIFAHLYDWGFQENHNLRSKFIRDLTCYLISERPPPHVDETPLKRSIPRTLIQYWHDLSALPSDVADCQESWRRLTSEGFEIRKFCDESAIAYISDTFGARERQAFERCRHPAMRSDYLRLCFVLAEGGFYVDADDVLLGDDWRELFGDDRLKVQPLCYDVTVAHMVPAADIWAVNLSTEGRIFYVNNNPIAAPAGHPILQAALSRATNRLLGEDLYPEIQETTGPGNLTAALVAHAHKLLILGEPLDFNLIRGWEAIAETRWNLSYRNDARNWRNMDAR